MRQMLNNSRRIGAVLSVFTVVVALSTIAEAQSQKLTQQPAITYTQDPNASKNMTLLLKDFDPKPMLHTAVHEVPRAKFPVIDVHNHVNDPGGIHGAESLPRK